MVAKKKLLGLAVVLGFVLAGVIALVRTPKRTVVAVAPEIATPTRSAPASGAHAPVPEREARAVREGDSVSLKAAVTNESRAAVVPVARPKPPRKPITNDPKIPKARQVLLANRRIAVEKGRSFPKKFCAAQTPTSRGTAPYVVISELPVSRDVRIQAVADGARVVGFLPNNALLVEADAQALKNLEEDVLFAAAVEYEPTDKIQRALLDVEKVESVEKVEGVATVEATVVLLNPKDHETIQKFVTDNGGVLLRGAPSEKSVSANIPMELVEKLAGKAEVKWIERHARFRANNDVAVLPGLMNVTPVWNDCGLTGAGQIISTSDSGIDTGDLATLHTDLRDAVVGLRAVSGCYTKDMSGDGHGTHTVGSLVGNGANSQGRIRGTACGAKLWAWGMSNGTQYLYLPPTYEDLFRPDGVDAHIHSASWGEDEALVDKDGGAYIDFCQDVDAFVWYNADFLPVFAAGNAGKAKAECTVMPPGTAKNILSVGACGHTLASVGQIADFSSRGPCQDGRVKPDVAAPGVGIYSTRTASSGKGKTGEAKYYQTMSGTSMATPLTAGTAALVREWLGSYRDMTNASAALVKAILTGGANGGAVPDNDFGWGRVDLGESIAPTNGTGVFLADRLPFGMGSNFTFRVTTTNAAPLSVQLVWVDYPGEPSAGKALVNDLDLSVTAAGERWLGNGGTEPDDENNVESVRIGAAAATTYLVRVKCSGVNVPYDDPELGGGAAALYIRGAFDPKAVECGAKVGTIWTIR